MRTTWSIAPCDHTGVRVHLKLARTGDLRIVLFAETDVSMPEFRAEETALPRRIAATLTTELDHMRALRREPPSAAPGHDDWLTGRLALREGHPLRAVARFELAAAHNGRWAAAQGDLAQALIVAARAGELEGGDRAAPSGGRRAQGSRAGPGNPEALAALGAVRLWFGGNPDEADNLLRRAIRSGPYLATAWAWHSVLLKRQGRLAASQDEAATALRLEPLWPYIAGELRSQALAPLAPENRPGKPPAADAQSLVHLRKP